MVIQEQFGEEILKLSKQDEVETDLRNFLIRRRKRLEWLIESLPKGPQCRENGNGSSQWGSTVRTTYPDAPLFEAPKKVSFLNFVN